MRLSETNVAPIYATQLPSTGKTVRYRPFLVKEERALLTAQESESEAVMLTTLEQVVKNCLKDNVVRLSSFDVEYLFTFIRSKSVGETSDVILTCGDCGVKNEVSLDLKSVKVVTPDGHSKKIKLSDTLHVTMQYPTIDDLTEVSMESNKNVAKDKLARMCIHSAHTEEDNYTLADESVEEVDAFMETLHPEQNDKLKHFINTIPYTQLKHKWECKGCKTKHETELKGILSFFS